MTTLFEGLTESGSLNEDLGCGTAILRSIAIDREAEIMPATSSWVQRL
jgi:hypothetical protein